MSDYNNRFGAPRSEFPQKPERAEKSLHDRVEDGTLGRLEGTPPPPEVQAIRIENAKRLRLEYEGLASSFMQRVFNRNEVNRARRQAEQAAEVAYGKG